MSCSRARLLLRAIAYTFAASVVLAVPSVASEAAAGSTLTRASVLSSGVWTDTGVTVHVGELVEINAAGRIHFGNPPIDRIAPAGIPWAGQCSGVAKNPQPWPAPGLACWSLIARIGSAPPFEIGVARTFRASLEGELFLGINDNFLTDNSGAWSANVRLTPRPGVTVPSTTASVPNATVPNTVAPASKDDSSSKTLVVIGVAAVVALVALVGLIALLGRRRAAVRGAEAAQPAKPEVREMVPASVVAGDISGDILPEPRGHAAMAPVVVTSFTGDPTDVNIFEVEFPDFASLRVGYSYFPEGTVVRWLVRQAAVTAATGEFVTIGGGGANHFVTILLGTDLRLSAEAADVEFTWDIGGVPFGYSVRRDPGA